MKRALPRVLLLVIAGVASIASAQTAPEAPAMQHGEATALFGAYGSNGTSPYDLGAEPPDHESWHAIAFVEVDGPIDIRQVETADFSLVDDQGVSIKASRNLLIEEFERPRAANEADCTFCMSGDRQRLWDGRLPARKIRLRIRAAFTSSAAARRNNLAAYRITIGNHTIEGPFGCRLPS